MLQSILKYCFEENYILTGSSMYVRICEIFAQWFFSFTENGGADLSHKTISRFFKSFFNFPLFYKWKKKSFENVTKSCQQYVQKAYRKTYNLNILSKDRPSFLHFKVQEMHRAFNHMLKSKNILLITTNPQWHVPPKINTFTKLL